MWADDDLGLSEHPDLRGHGHIFEFDGLETEMREVGRPPLDCRSRVSCQGRRLRDWLRLEFVEPSRPILAVARAVRRKNLIALAQAFAASPALRATADLVILSGQPDRMPLSSEGAAVLAEIAAVLDDPRLAGIAVRIGHHTHAEVPAL